MNIIYVDSTEVLFDTIEHGHCFAVDGIIYMKIYHSYPNKLNAIDMETGTGLWFEEDYIVTPVYTELYVTGYNKEEK